MHDVAGMVVFFGFLAAVIIVPQVIKSRDRQRMFETMRVAYERGQAVPPEMVDALTRRGRDPVVPPEIVEAMARRPDIDPLSYLPESSASRDLRRGVVWVSVGVGLVLVGAAFYLGLYNDGGAAETFATFAALGAIPLCVGLAFLGLAYFNRRSLQTPPARPQI